MRWFFIDTHERGFACLGFVDDDKNSIKKYQVKPGALIEVLDKSFNKQHIADSDGIILVQGPGSFSAIRAGVLIGNMLARILNIPLYGINVQESNDPNNLPSKIKAKKIKALEYADPIYDSEPNITMPKTI